MSRVPTSVPTVYLVDDDPSVSRALERFFRVAGFQFVAFTTAQDFLNHESFESPACVVLDVELPDQNGLELQAELKKRGRSASIVFITGHGDVSMAVEAMRAGAIHFLPKPFDNRNLLAAVRQAIDLDSEAASQRDVSRDIESRFATLTPRERQVFSLVAAGAANKSIAAQLGLSLQTIKLYRGRVMQKLALKSVAALARLAERVDAAGTENLSLD
jgi:FixJ family two-component response regulator